MSHQDSCVTSVTKEILSEDYLLEIFKKLNLNERAKLRLVSKEFKRIVDLIKIRKLAFFHRVPIRDGRFRLVDDDWSLKDTVYVTDCKKFFKNKSILASMGSIEKLTIFGAANGQLCEMNVKFNSLKHLEIEYFDSKYSTIIKSPNLETVFNGCCFESDEQYKMINPFELSWQTGIYSIKSTKIRSLQLILLVGQGLFEYGVSKRLFDNLAEIRVCLMQTDVIKYLNRKIPSLKKLIFSIFLPDAIDMDTVRTVVDLSKDLRKDLSIFLMGIRIDKSTSKLAIDFFEEMTSNFVSMTGRFAFRATNESMEILKRYQNKNSSMFDEFHNFFGYLVVEEPIDDLKMFNDEIKRMKNLEGVFYTFKRAEPINFTQYLTCIPDVREMQIKLAYLSVDDDRNQILDLLPIYCKKLHTLTIHCWSKINFKFLFKMNSLKFIKIITPTPSMEQDEYIGLIRQLAKYLALFEVFFEKTPESNRDQLKAFKADVLQCLKDVKLNDVKFKIELHRTTQNEVVRYLMIRKGFSYSDEETANNDDLVEIHKMASVFQMISQM